MSRYQITLEELKFLNEMINFLSDKGNSCSDQGSQQVKEVIDRIASRPVLEQVIDPKVFLEHAEWMGTDSKVPLSNEEENQTNDNRKEETNND